ncbi:MAG: cupin domain-containing protein [Alphaproteobacteria bacterium]|nr:cupin domain-containing protein [Alphaproteobacteria bacterium]MDE1986563.1 cupin domain-containing protein [Alphaproteobacteria bacterium]MDE2164175.1 cupin domain-containing protein [Alphaproteobacteria bacterium]MDE2265898.1 cupin domain-containing protein [Alphaproteobacteria bacterium]
MTKFLAVLCIAGMTCLSTAALAATPYATNANRLIARTDTTIIGQKIEVPKNPTVIVSSSTFAPGMRTPVHKHLYPHYVYIMDGTLTVVNSETGKSYDMKPGTFFLEMLNTWHYGINKGAVPVHTLVVDQVPAGVKVNHVLKDPTEKEGLAWKEH